MTLKHNISQSRPAIPATRKGRIKDEGSDSSVEYNLNLNDTQPRIGIPIPLIGFTSNPPSVSSDTDLGFNPGNLLFIQFA